MRAPEWLSLVLFSFFVLASWVRPSPRRSRVVICLIGAIGISAIIGVEFTARLFSPFTPSVIRDWLPAPLMLMVYWQAGQFAGPPKKKFQDVLYRFEHRWLGTLLERLEVRRSYRW